MSRLTTDEEEKDLMSRALKLGLKILIVSLIANGLVVTGGWDRIQEYIQASPLSSSSSSTSSLSSPSSPSVSAEEEAAEDEEDRQLLERLSANLLTKIEAGKLDITPDPDDIISGHERPLFGYKGGGSQSQSQNKNGPQQEEFMKPFNPRGRQII